MLYFIEGVFRASSFDLATVFNSCFPYLIDTFVENNKNPNRLTYFFYFEFSKITCHFYLLISNPNLSLFSNSSGLPFIKLSVASF